MKRYRGYFLFFSAIAFISSNWALKCRNPGQTAYDPDMEQAVRQCVRQMQSNGTEQKDTGLYSTLREWERPHRTEELFRPNRDTGKHNQETPWLRERYPRPNRNGNNQEEEEENGFERQPDRRRFRGRERPHTVNQQNQYDRDNRFNHNRRPIFQPDPDFQRQGDSRMSGIDACMIYCVFQELKMLDDWGQLDKNAVMDQMTHRLRDREVRDFLQYTIDDCMSEQQDDRRPQDSCKAVKNFAMCLEDRGRRVCEDWNEPITSTEKNINFSSTEREKPKEGPKKGLKNSMRG